jgi:hypothetical protein
MSKKGPFHLYLIMPILPYNENLCRFSGLIGFDIGVLTAPSDSDTWLRDCAEVDDAVLFRGPEGPFRCDTVQSEVDDVEVGGVLASSALLQSQHGWSLFAIPTTSFSEQPVCLPSTVRDRTQGSPLKR